jgi:hypothetical protein
MNVRLCVIVDNNFHTLSLTLTDVKEVRRERRRLSRNISGNREMEISTRELGRLFCDSISTEIFLHKLGQGLVLGNVNVKVSAE